MEVVNLLYGLARQSLKIRGFGYGKSFAKGAGNSFYPLLWVDDPIYCKREGNTMVYSVNFDLLSVPSAQTDAAIEAAQTEAITTALAVVEKIKRDSAHTSFSSRGDSYVTLRNYYDDNAAGVRCSLDLIGRVPSNLCKEEFDPAGELPTREGLPNFSAENPRGCAVFNDKEGLPSFSLSDIDLDYAFFVDADGKHILTLNGQYLGVLKRI